MNNRVKEIQARVEGGLTEHSQLAILEETFGTTQGLQALRDAEYLLDRVEKLERVVEAVKGNAECRTEVRHGGEHTYDLCPICDALTALEEEEGL